MPETVDKSSLSTLFPKYSPQLRLIDFFHAAPFPRCFHRSLPLFSLFAPPAFGFSLSLFCFFFATSPFLCLHLSSFLLRRAYFSAVLCHAFFLAVLCHAFFGCCRESFLISARAFSFLFSARYASPLLSVSTVSFFFGLILLLPHFAFAASSSGFCFLLHFPAAMLALSLRPAILFIYLNYHCHMNTHSLARRFLP